MNSEFFRIARELRDSFGGTPWHGPTLSELLGRVTADQATMRPLPNIHSILELVRHIDVWAQVALDATNGVAMPRLYGTEKDWTIEDEVDAQTWAAATAHLFQTGERLACAVETFSDDRLLATVPGRQFDFYFLFHGVIHHSVYHAGQIAMLGTACRNHFPAQ